MNRRQFIKAGLAFLVIPKGILINEPVISVKYLSLVDYVKATNGNQLKVIAEMLMATNPILKDLPFTPTKEVSMNKP